MSATLNDHVDRLTQLANSIRSTTTSDGNVFNTLGRPSVAGPFTRAVLTTPLGDLIRDIDPSETGLFTIVQPPQPGAAPASSEGDHAGSSMGEIARVGFVGATPLRRPPMGRDGIQRAREHEPEVYAHAALKYLDKYDSIRPMPRAVEQAERILEELAAVRESIDSLSERLLQTNDAGPSQPPPDPKSMAKEEERRIQELQTEIAELRKQKENILRKKTGIRSAAALTPRRKPTSKPAMALSPTSPDAAEHSFWNTPAASARTLHFTEDSLLTDEHMDLSAPSLASPLNDSVRGPPVRGKMPERAIARQLMFEPTKKDELSAEEKAANDSFEESPPLDVGATAVVEDDDFDEDDMTIMMKKSSPLASELPQQDPNATIELTTAPIISTSGAAQMEPKKQRFKITEEMEAVVSKIWTAMGDVIMPGNPYDLNGSGIGVKPPRAKETLAHLQQLSLQTTSPTSPNTSITSDASTQHQQQPGTQVTTQQILVAHVLLSLLSSPPNYSMALGKLKEVLAEKNGGATAQAVTRPIYACVAKKLLKIERGRGEQTVKFDM
ncbi:hypothetical protein BXZ70DRAFT_948436 [Cristinia sonorae]|uniref:Uncharacterized protein n=1 Tax=Cristinia sonorae TaxID=1940300 RepID=A0A8K0XMP2_9AGAR|nr:hypothetical protein BXZ70DRAFT_948436 [Cristinia sonorae]